MPEQAGTAARVIEVLESIRPETEVLIIVGELTYRIDTACPVGYSSHGADEHIERIYLGIEAKPTPQEG